MNSEWWRYENLVPCEKGKGWGVGGTAQSHPDDFIDYHLDLGCGKIPKARLGIDRNQGDIQMNLDTGQIFSWKEGEQLANTTVLPVSSASPDNGGAFAKVGILPFPDNSIESIISHHFFEHLTPDGFINLIDDCYRVLVPNGKLRIIVPLFPSRTSWESTDHKMWIGKETFTDFTGNESSEHWHENFATPYTKARFKQTAMDYTPAPVVTGSIVNGNVMFSVDGGPPKPILNTDEIFDKPREIRVTLQKGN